MGDERENIEGVEGYRGALPADNKEVRAEALAS